MSTRLDTKAADDPSPVLLVRVQLAAREQVAYVRKNRVNQARDASEAVVDVSSGLRMR